MRRAARRASRVLPDRSPRSTVASVADRVSMRGRRARPARARPPRGRRRRGRRPTRCGGRARSWLSAGTPNTDRPPGERHPPGTRCRSGCPRCPGRDSPFRTSARGRRVFGARRAPDEPRVLRGAGDEQAVASHDRRDAVGRQLLGLEDGVERRGSTPAKSTYRIRPSRITGTATPTSVVLVARPMIRSETTAVRWPSPA